MNNFSKRDAMKAWLAANQGKTQRDWLLEVRCQDDVTRQAALRLLNALDKANVEYSICQEHINYHTKYQKSPMLDVESIVFDLVITPELRGQNYIIEMDMPDQILGKTSVNARGEEIPEEAYNWLLKQWFPDFETSSVDEKHYHKLMWEDMAGWIGQYKIPDWKSPDFAGSLVKRIASLRGQIAVLSQIPR